MSFSFVALFANVLDSFRNRFSNGSQSNRPLAAARTCITLLLCFSVFASDANSQRRPGRAPEDDESFCPRLGPGTFWIITDKTVIGARGSNKLDGSDDIPKWRVQIGSIGSQTLRHLERLPRDRYTLQDTALHSGATFVAIIPHPESRGTEGDLAVIMQPTMVDYWTVLISNDPDCGVAAAQFYKRVTP